MIKLSEMREFSVSEIKSKISETEEELANLRFQHALHQLDNVIKVRLLRRELARLRTVLREHELGKRPLSEAKIEKLESRA